MAIGIQQLIGGAWRDGSGPTLESRNPANPEHVVASGLTAQVADVDDAVAAASTAAALWRRTPIHERALILRRAATLLDQRAEQYGMELTIEEGKTLAEGIGEVRRAAEIFRFNADEANRQAGDLFASPRLGERIMVVRKPLGVVGIITPWNFPVAIPAWKIAPALIHGNAVIWKPASLVPLLAYRLTQALDEAGLPPGVISLLIGPGPIGSRLAEHPGVRGLTFTGSTEVGTTLLQTCAAARKPIQAEMGGKNAAVVLADADLDLAAQQVVIGAMRSTGQKCTATSRVIVAEQVQTEFLQRVSQLVSEIVIGDGTDARVTMGPAASLSAQQEIQAAISSGLAAGAKILAQAEPGGESDGFFVPATVMQLPDTSLDLWRDEVFGPVLAVTSARDTAHAFELANDSVFGLSAGVFTSDLTNALTAIEVLDVGVLHVNSETAGADPHVPFGGSKESGYGPKEQGRASREFFTQTTTVYLR